MCTSFIHRGKDTLIAMNFDNNGMKFSISTKDPHWFVVHVDGGRGKYPSFGVNSDGVFFNNLIVDSNGKGQYKRPSSKVTHTTKLVTDILSGVVLADELDEYLKKIEVVNTPDWSCHNMICDSRSNAWIIEPGRGNLYDDAAQSQFSLMTNFSLWDSDHLDLKIGCNRYNTALCMLNNSTDLDVSDAFKILESVSQNSGEWNTDLSMVYSKNNRTVYFCYARDFNDIKQYRFVSRMEDKL